MNAHEDHLALKRLKLFQPFITGNIIELERMLIDAGGTGDTIDRATERSNGLSLFIRSFIGLDFETSNHNFSKFFSGNYVTANHNEFIKQIIEQLTKSCLMEPERLYEVPFTDIHSQGAAGVFSIEKADQIRYMWVKFVDKHKLNIMIISVNYFFELN